MQAALQNHLYIYKTLNMQLNKTHLRFKVKCVISAEIVTFKKMTVFKQVSQTLLHLSATGRLNILPVQSQASG